SDRCDIELFQRSILEYGTCPDCHLQNTFICWCKSCNSERFRKNFMNWTSGDENINDLIREAQLSAESPWEILEFIPYDRLRDIIYLSSGGFSHIYKAIWIDSYIRKWDPNQNDWVRKKLRIHNWSYIYDTDTPTINSTIGRMVVLKSLKKFASKELLLTEVVNHLRSFKAARKIGSMIFPLVGITKNPMTLEYMVVMNNWLECHKKNKDIEEDSEVMQFRNADKKLKESSNLISHLRSKSYHPEASCNSRFLNPLPLSNMYKIKNGNDKITVN
ncbi:11362_t:CDS:2, partial [Scutellospora calospora]